MLKVKDVQRVSLKGFPKSSGEISSSGRRKVAKKGFQKNDLGGV